MADPNQIVFLVALGFISIVGCVLNGLSLAVLALDAQLRKHLTSVRWLMFGEALSMFIMCSVGAPLLFASTLVDDGTSTDATIVRCGFMLFSSYITASVAMWFQTIIALTRVAAVFVPMWYRKVVKQRRFVGSCLFVTPWLLSYGMFATGAVARVYSVHVAPGIRSCFTFSYDNSTQAAARFGLFSLSTSVICVWLPICLGLLCYVSIYAKKVVVWHKKQRANKIEAGGNNSKSIVQTTSLTAAASQQRQKNSNDKLRLLSVAYLVEFALVFPVSFLWAANLYIYLQANAPMVFVIFNSMSLMSFAIIPLVYLAISADFRQAYRRLVLKLSCRTMFE